MNGDTSKRPPDDPSPPERETGGARPGSRWKSLVTTTRALLIAAAVAAVALVAHRLDLHALGIALRSAKRGWMGLATGLVVARTVSRAVVWRVSLHAEPAVPLRRLVRYTMAADAASIFMPARAGEVLRLWLLRRESGVTIRRSTGVALGEKILDGLALLVLVLPMPWLVSDLPRWVTRAIGGLAVLAVPGLAVGWWVGRRRPGAGRIASFLGQIRILREPRTLAWAFLACLTAWLLDLTALWTSVRAVGVNVGFGGATFVLLVVNAAIVVPSTPGNLGTLETGAVLALALLRVARPQAAAAALLYHGIQLLPLLLFALLNPRLMLGGRSRARLAVGLPGLD